MIKNQYCIVKVLKLLIIKVLTITVRQSMAKL